MQVQLPLCAHFPLTAGVPCPNLREEGGLPAAKTTADLYKLICVGGIVLCRVQLARPSITSLLPCTSHAELQCRQDAESARAKQAI